MPRLARLDAPGILHHVMGRGIEGKEIFYNDTDRNDFIDRLAVLSEEDAIDVYAWVLMPNHFHILCKTRKRALSSCMRKILTGYVVNFNRRHQRYGHLFQNRYCEGGFAERYIGDVQMVFAKPLYRLNNIRPAL